MNTQSGPLLRTEQLVKQFKRRTVVREVSITLEAGETVGLLGPNGAGKTTTFRMVVGLLRPTSGAVWFNGADVTRLPMYKRARAGMAYLPQEPSVFQKLTVRQNLLAVLEFLPLTRAERGKRADSLLDDLGIAHVAGSPAYTLSGGERRRTEICRALVTDPKVFLLDEPFAGIDPIAVADLQDTVDALKRRGIGVLITDHNVRETLEITDRAYIISEGRIAVSGSPREIAENPIARETYLGERFRMDFDLKETPASAGGDPALITDDDITHWQDFLAALYREDAGTPGRRVLELMDPSVRELLASRSDAWRDQDARHAVIVELNILLRRPDLYRRESWKNIPLDNALRKQVKGKLQSLDARRLTQVNRRLLDAAFSPALKPQDRS